MTIELLILGICLPDNTYSQGNSGNFLAFKDTVDVIGGNFKMNKLPITKKQAEDTIKYRNFLRDFAGNNRNLWPYFPYVLINPTYFTGGPLRIYLGRRTEGANEYVLIAVQAKKFTGRQGKNKLINYVDDSATFAIGRGGLKIKKDVDWISIRFSRRPNGNDSVFYSKISEQVARQYIYNFAGKTPENSFQRLYKYCFVVSGTKGLKKRLLLQPVVKTSLKKMARADSTMNKKAGPPEEKKTIQFEGNNVCCYSPPEGGASVNPID